MRTLIKDAHCVLPSDTAHDVVQSHVLLERGRILDIDAHVHCRDPGASQKEDLAPRA